MKEANNLRVSCQRGVQVWGGLLLLLFVVFSTAALKGTENSTSTGNQTIQSNPQSGLVAQSMGSPSWSSGERSFWRSLWRAIKRIIRAIIDFFRDVIDIIVNTFSWFVNLVCRGLWGVSCLNLTVPVGWVGLQGAPLVDHPEQAGQPNWTQVARARMAEASRISVNRAAISQRPGVTIFAPQFPTMEDFWVPAGHTPGDVISLDEDLGFLELVVHWLRAELELSLAGNYFRIVDLHVRDFTDRQGNSVDAAGWGVIGGIFVAPWAATVDPTLLGSPYDANLIDHENFHVMSLWHLNDANNLMYGGPLGPENELTSWQVTQAQTALFLSGWVSVSPRFKKWMEAVDSVPALREAFRDDLNSFVYLDAIHTDFMMKESFRDAPQVNIMKGAVKWSVDSGSVFQILVPTPPPLRATATTYYIALDLDRNDATGGDPRDIGSPSAADGGVDIVAAVSVEMAKSGESVVNHVLWEHDGSGFVPVDEPLIRSRFIGVIAEGISLTADGRMEVTDSVNIGSVVEIAIPYSAAPIEKEGMVTQLASYDSLSGAVDSTVIDLLAFPVLGMATVELSPNNACPGCAVTVEVSGMLPNAPLKLLIDGTEIDIGTVITNEDGDATFALNVPHDFVGDVYTITVGDAQLQITAEAMLIVSSAFKVAIEKKHAAYQGHVASVGVTLANAPSDFAGFDFLIGYDNSALMPITAEPGPQFFAADPDTADTTDLCGWEYFTYRFGAEGNCSNCPSGLLRVVGMAELNNGPNHPTCFMPDDFDEDHPATLFSLKFLVSNDRNLGCQFVPIHFYWRDCGDNTISSVTGDTLWLDGLILGFENDTVWNEFDDVRFVDAARPQGVGAPDVCLIGGKREPIRCITFVNGGIDIVCPDSVDLRGDLNLNSVANEIADAVLYTNYFIYGDGVFDISYEGQVAASDVNNDGRPLTVGDLVYLIRIVTGDELPFSKMSPFVQKASVDLRVNHATVTVATSSSAEIGAAYFVFKHDGYVSGEPYLINGASQMTLKSHDEDGVLKVLVYSMEKGKKIRSGMENLLVIPISGQGTIALAETQLSDYYGNMLLITSTKQPVLPKAFALQQNYPNPFNATTVINYELPKAVPVKIEIFNITGQKVTTLVDAEQQPGFYTVEWNGTDQFGHEVASGVYLYRLTADQYSSEKKMVLMK